MKSVRLAWIFSAIVTMLTKSKSSDHINELIKATNEGYETYLAFVIQMNGIEEVRPNIDTHREFGIALDEALKAGVKILFLGCSIFKDEIKINLCMEKKTCP